MDTAWARTGSSPSSQLLRLLTSTADYAMVLLRTLELMTGEPVRGVWLRVNEGDFSPSWSPFTLP